MTTADTYKLLTAAVAFRESYKHLHDAYSKMSDADFREQYPLGCIDIFDDNTKKGIVAWLNCHTTKLINSLPDKVLNPTCIKCLLNKSNKHTTDRNGYISPTLSLSGSCNSDSACYSYPYVTFDPEMIKAFLKRQTYDKTVEISDNVYYDDSAIRTMYHKVLSSIKISEDVKK